MMAELNEKSIKNIVKSIETFNANFYRKIANKTEGNFINSALSAHTVLSMTACGARGNTAVQMKKALHLPDNDSMAHTEFQNLIDTVENVQEVVLKLANKIFISKEAAIEDEFLKITKDYFRSQSGQMDVSQPELTAQIINKWCAEQTNEKITNLIKPDDINPLTVMVLLNAVYFKGDWKNKFDVNRTSSKKFYLNKTATIEVPTMQIKSNFLYKPLDELNAKCIIIPYVNKDLAMEIIVPNKIDGLPFIENNVGKLSSGRAYMQECILSMPKFKLESEIDLNELLMELGMCDMFSDSRANFSGIANLSSLYVSKVRQKAFIEVNENGSEAAAVTAVIMKIRSLPSPPKIFNVDRPFLFRIVYKSMTLFSGRVVNPLEK